MPDAVFPLLPVSCPPPPRLACDRVFCTTVRRYPFSDLSIFALCWSTSSGTCNFKREWALLLYHRHPTVLLARWTAFFHQSSNSIIGCLRLRTRLRGGHPPVGAFLGARVWYGYPIPPELSASPGYQHDQPTSTGHHSRTGLLFARSSPPSDLRHVAHHRCATCRFRSMSELGMNPSCPHLEKHTCSVSVPNSTFGLAVRPHLR
ncbi:hypothetical protein B0H65DRAFT_137305 [Neurospora tetraspora]|uniref:Uncharacterized protein n=1 Tax=Neurospora tetraspora TaxID=94610 RepID=A0AAE0JLJ1_9PEZI|nr:hypothetical protein B0H65DRAFT_137305 [Neurospora tetraspora]